jgi:hypothetical protein
MWVCACACVCVRERAIDSPVQRQREEGESLIVCFRTDIHTRLLQELEPILKGPGWNLRMSLGEYDKTLVPLNVSSQQVCCALDLHPLPSLVEM